MSDTDTDTECWNTKAISTAIKAEKMLWGKNNEGIQAWMYESGLCLATIRSAHLGWQSRNSQRPAEGWGIQGVDKVHLPEGITIPIICERVLKRIVIFRMGHGHDGDYHTVEGSAPVPLILSGDPKRVAFIRGELDALLLHQELKGEWTVAATGGLPVSLFEGLLHEAQEARLITTTHDKTPLTPWHPTISPTAPLPGESLIALARSGALTESLASLF